MPGPVPGPGKSTDTPLHTERILLVTTSYPLSQDRDLRLRQAVTILGSYTKQGRHTLSF